MRTPHSPKSPSLRSRAGSHINQLGADINHELDTHFPDLMRLFDRVYTQLPVLISTCRKRVASLLSDKNK